MIIGFDREMDIAQEPLARLQALKVEKLRHALTDFPNEEGHHWH
jgi:hypothetical protein